MSLQNAFANLSTEPKQDNVIFLLQQILLQLQTLNLQVAVAYDIDPAPAETAFPLSN